MSEHSKGPWTAEEPFQRDGRWSAAVRVGTYDGQSGPGNTICIVYLGGPGATCGELADIKANALVIAASPELVEAVRRALWHVTGDCNSWLRTAVQEFVAETGQSARDAVGYTNEFHSWCEAREARDAAFLRAALKKAGVEP